MIRKSALNISFANTGKLVCLDSILKEGKRVINLYIDRLWELKDFSSKFVDFKVETWFSARMQQCLGKQALGIVKSQRKRKKKTKPKFQKDTLNLDSRFVQFLDIENSFDFWITISSIGKKIKLWLPSKKHKHFNQFIEDDWIMKKSIELRKVNGKFFVNVYFEKEVKYKNEGAVIGIDTGYKKLAVTSAGEYIGIELEKKIEKISRKQQGSKAFHRALKERDQYIDREIKKIDLDNTKAVVVEGLKDVKKNSKKQRRISTKFMNKLQRWVYSYFLSRLEQTCEVNGVRIHKVDPVYTSQICSVCGNRDSRSRKGEKFCCTACGFSADADWNASQNILSKFLVQESIVPALEIIL